jgi:hypothetical protein
MSIKTLRKRIALVAVSALGAGVMSVIAAPVANAADGDRVEMSTVASTTGSAVASATEANARQVGYVTATNTDYEAATASLISLSGGDAFTAICLSTCSMPFEIENTTNSVGLSVVVTGGVLSSVSDSITLTNGSGTLSVAGDRKAATLVVGSTDSSLLGIATASSGATSMVLQFFEGASVAGLTTATSGSLVAQVTFTIAAASASGVYSEANSTIAVQASYAAGSTASGLLTYDTTSKISNGYRGAIYVKLADAYTAAITSGTITAAATNGSYVNIADALPAAGDDYAAASAYDAETDGLAGGDAYITVTQPVANTAGSTTVTITFNGSVIATKTLSWVGDIASIAIDTANSNAIFKNGADNDFTGGQNGLIYVVKDAAGNVVQLDDTSSANDNGPTMTGQTGAMVGASVTATLSSTTAVLQTKALGYGTTTVNVPSSSLTGAGSFKLRVKNASGGNVDSAVYSVTVSEDSLNSFAVSWDKTTYAPGELATLTITGKDSVGNVIADGMPLTGLSLTVATGLTAVGTACAATSTFAAGKVTCKYSAGNTDGAYSYSIDMTTATPQAASVGAVNVKTAGVTSNAEVLAAIVKLIASINKQIRALQKSIKR